MKFFNILGKSPGFISMVGDLLFKIHGKDLKINIIKNIEVKEGTPYKSPYLSYEEIDFKDWDVDLSNMFLGVGKVESKKAVFNFFRENSVIDASSFINILHPATDLPSSYDLGKGILCNNNVTLSPFCRIGDFVTINRHVSIGHHSKIGKFSVLNPGVNIAGLCNISEGVTIGMGSNILDGVNIGSNTIIGAGSLVTKDIPDNVIAYGSPAKIIRKRD